MKTLAKATIHSLTELDDFTKSLVSVVKPGSICLFYAEMGAGKTTFSQGFALGLGINESVISPTFKLVSEYHGKRALNHIDCYRLESSSDFLNIGGENFLNTSDGITIIEWADRIKDIWLDDWIIIYFDRDENNSNIRHIKITGNNQ